MVENCSREKCGPFLRIIHQDKVEEEKEKK